MHYKLYVKLVIVLQYLKSIAKKLPRYSTTERNMRKIIYRKILETLNQTRNILSFYGIDYFSVKSTPSFPRRAGNYRHEILRVQRSSSIYCARREDREGGCEVRTLSRPFGHIGRCLLRGRRDPASSVRTILAHGQILSIEY